MEIGEIDVIGGVQVINSELTGDSKAYDISFANKFTVALVGLSSVGKLQYSLNSEKEVEDDDAEWIDWHLGEVTENAGAFFESGVNFIRVICSGTYTLQFKRSD